MIKRTLPVLLYCALAGAYRADSASSATPWFEAVPYDHAMHERDYPAGFAAGVAVNGSAAVQIHLVTPAYEIIPDWQIHEASEIIRSGTLGFLIRSATGWDFWPEPLDALRDRVEELEGGTEEEPENSFTIVSDLLGIYDEIDSQTTTYTIWFPSGRRMKQDGTFLLLISGAPFADSARVIWGRGGIERGLQIALTTGTWEAGDIVRGHFQMEDDAAVNDDYLDELEADEAGGLSLPGDPPLMALSGSVIR